MKFLRCVCQIFIDGRLLKYFSLVFIYRLYLSTESIFTFPAAALLLALPIFPRQCLSLQQYPSSCNIYSQNICARYLPMGAHSIHLFNSSYISTPSNAHHLSEALALSLLTISLSRQCFLPLCCDSLALSLSHSLHWV